MTFKRLALAASVLAALSACTATTSFQANKPDATLTINKDAPLLISQASSHKYGATSFGQYIFKVGGEDQAPMYGLMPLKFNGGYLAADILFFAPAMFFNLREMYPYYEFDVDKGVVRYKKKLTDSWRTYTPTQMEIDRAKKYFNN